MCKWTAWGMSLRGREGVVERRDELTAERANAWAGRTGLFNLKAGLRIGRDTKQSMVREIC